MFLIKCVDCKFFSPKDGCRFDLDEENCTLYEKVAEVDEPISCEACTWNCNGFCDYDLSPTPNCNRFRKRGEEEELL